MVWALRFYTWGLFFSLNVSYTYCMETSSGIIYGLHDPETKELRYVGQTIQELEIRRKRHVYDAQYGANNHRCNWIRSVLATGKQPIATIICEVPVSELDTVEIETIIFFREEGVRLVNTDNGGGGRRGYVPTMETRQKMSAAHKGHKHTEESRRKISLANTGNPKRVGKTHTAKTIAKMSAVHTGIRHTPESKAKIAAANLGNKNASRYKNQRAAEETLRCNFNAWLARATLRSTS